MEKKRRWGRSSTNRVILGVCGGLAESFGLNATAVRVVFVVLLVITRSFWIWAYLLLAAIMPQRRDDGPRPGARPASEWKQQWDSQRQGGDTAWKADAQDVDYREGQPGDPPEE